MAITTSNYATRGEYTNSYAISVRPPVWYKGKSFPLLAPTWEMVMGIRDGLINEEQYSTMFFSHLLKKGTTADKVLEILPSNACLLCYEPGFTFCHRRLVALWIENETGIKINEWVDPSVTSVYNFMNNTLEF